MSDASPYPFSLCDDQAYTTSYLDSEVAGSTDFAKPLTIAFDYFAAPGTQQRLVEILQQHHFQLHAATDHLNSDSVVFLHFHRHSIWTRAEMEALDSFAHGLMAELGGKPDGWYIYSQEAYTN